MLILYFELINYSLRQDSLQLGAQGLLGGVTLGSGVCMSGQTASYSFYSTNGFNSQKID